MKKNFSKKQNYKYLKAYFHLEIKDLYRFSIKSKEVNSLQIFEKNS